MTDISLTRAMTDPALFGGVFGGSSFWTWKVVAKVIDGIRLVEPREIELFKACTGRTQLPNRHGRRVLRRLIILAGRRAGKDRFFSGVAIWRAALCTNWNQHISAGEQAVVLLLGRDRRQAAILRRYCQGLLRQPLLAAEIVRKTDDVIEFRNGSSLEIASNDVNLVRGRSAIAVLGGETCYWKSDEHAASSDEEVTSAAEKSMAMCPDGGLLLLGSSIYRKRGYMYRQYRKLNGNDDSDDICWFADSTTMNPKLRQEVVDSAMAEDPAKAGAEFGRAWRDDIADFCPPECIEAVTEFGVRERPPLPGLFYYAFVDAAGGTGSDSFALCIAHRLSGEDRMVVIDAIREFRPRFIPSEVIRELAILLKSYRISEVVGDGFAGGFHSDEWRKNNIRFKAAEHATSENYLRALPMILNKRALLIDSPTLRSQFASLERRTTSVNREQVSHPQVASAHDDVATACAGALVIAGAGYGYDPLFRGFQETNDKPPPPRTGPTGAEFFSYLPSLGAPPWIR
jgi:hypothetical protein